MILTTCAACADPLAHDAPRCVRCKVRYCDSTCQHDHWRRGHKQMCKKIHRGGNAEQYNADKKYKEAVAVAVEACADDTGNTLAAACNYANTLLELGRFEEVRSLMRKTIPVSRRVLGECDILTLRTRWNYARALYSDPAATLDDLRETVTTLEDTTRIARRVLGSSHPLTLAFEEDLQTSRELLVSRETPPRSA